MGSLAEISEQDIKPLNFLNILSDCDTTYDVFRVLKSICKNFGFHSFLAMRLPQGSTGTLDEVVIITNWNPEMIRAYDAMGLVGASPVISRLRQSALPFDWRLDDIDRKDASEEVKNLIDLFGEFDFKSGVYFPTTDNRGNRGAIGLATNASDVDQEQLPDLNYIAAHVYDRLIAIENAVETKREILTDREIECLNWAAAGKTSAETSLILGISENTVNHYFTNAATKLDTVNKAHTVAKALRMGLLED